MARVKTRLASSASLRPNALAASMEPPMPNRMLMVGNSVMIGVTTLMADMPSGPMRLLTTMASVIVARRWASDARTDANIKVLSALDTR